MSVSRWIASGGGIGYFPVASGTVASFAALPIGAAALWFDHRLLFLLGVIACVLGTWAIHAAKVEGDPGWIVIDEFAGQWIALLGLDHISLAGIIAAFVLFRVFDIAKPGPVGWADRRHDATGVMADDVIAGLMVAIILYLAAWVMPGWW